MVHSTLAQSDSFDLVDYSGLSGPDRNVGGGYSDISSYDADYFEPFTSKHNYLCPEDMKPAGLEGTTTGTCLITIVHIIITLFYQRVCFLKGICCQYRYDSHQFAFANTCYFGRGRWLLGDDSHSSSSSSSYCSYHSVHGCECRCRGRECSRALGNYHIFQCISRIFLRGCFGYGQDLGGVSTIWDGTCWD